MFIAIVALSVSVIIMGGYITFLQIQLHSISKQLERRLSGNASRTSVSVDLLDHGINYLVCNLNKCFKADEKLRLEAVIEEKHFKEMIANISHDLRTPLTAIKGYQQLMEKGDLTEEQQKRLKIAQKHADELGDLIEHFFEYSYLLNNESKPELSRINLTNLTAECLADSVAVFEEKHIAIEYNSVNPVFVLADKDMTIRIINNLLRNCLQHSESDVSISIAAEQQAIISFKNAAKNASDIDADRIFERFYVSEKSRNKSTGLGLSIVKLLAEQMGGNSAASIKDGILEIKVLLPLY